MSNTLLTISMITNEALMVLENQLTFTKYVNRQYDDRFAQQGAKIGDVINVRKPVRYVGRRTATLSVENSTESSVPLVLTNQYGCDVSFTSKELTLDIDEFSDRILKPAIATVANMIDFDGLQLYKDVYNLVGTPGTTPSSNLTYLNAGVKLDNEAAPKDGERRVCLNPIADATIVNANLALFNPQGKISSQYEKGMMAEDILGFDWYMDQNIGVQTIGTYVADVPGGAVTVNGAVTSGSTIVLAGWTSGDELKQGDIVTFAGVFAVNPQNRQSTGQLRQWVLTADATANGAGAMTISVSPAIVFSGQYQTVTSSTNSIANGVVVSVYGASGVSTPQNLAFHRDAFAFATTDLVMPGGVDMAKRVTSGKLGMSMRLVRQYDINNDRFPCRIDILGGWKTIRPELACRVAG